MQVEVEAEKKEGKRYKAEAVKQAPTLFLFQIPSALSPCLPSLPSAQQPGFGEIKHKSISLPLILGGWTRGWNQCLKGRHCCKHTLPSCYARNGT